MVLIIDGRVVTVYQCTIGGIVDYTLEPLIYQYLLWKKNNF